MTPAFRLRGVSKRYEPFVLEALDLDLPEGQIMGLVGVNGAGKTTLLRLLAGLTLPDTGSVEVLGWEEAPHARSPGAAWEGTRWRRPPRRSGSLPRIWRTGARLAET